MTKVNLRSTASLTTYVKTVDKLAALAMQIDALQKTEKQLRPEILAEIHEHDGRRAVIVAGTPRVLTIKTKESIKQDADDSVIVEAAKAAGVKVSERSAEYVHSATLGKAYREGLLLDFVTVETTEIVEVI
jgi:DNA-binding protein YbaB